MKPLYLLTILVALSLSVSAQYANLKKATALKTGKLIVAYSGNAEQDELLKANVDKYWKTTPVIDYMPYWDALKKAKEDPSYFLITIVKDKSTHTTESGEKLENFSAQLAIQTNTRGTVCDQVIAKENPTNINFAFGVIYLNHLVNAMIDNNLKNMGAYYKYAKSQTPKVLEEKFYVVENDFADEYAKNQFIKHYKGSYEMADRATVERKLLNQEENAVVLYYVPRSMGNGYYYENFLIDASTGQLLLRTKDMMVQPGNDIQEKLYLDDVNQMNRLIKKATQN